MGCFPPNLNFLNLNFPPCWVDLCLSAPSLILLPRATEGDKSQAQNVILGLIKAARLSELSPALLIMTD